MRGGANAAANPLTARFGLTHGHAVGLMLPHVVRFNAADASTRETYVQLARDAGLVGDACTDKTAVNELAARVAQMLSLASLPRTLAECGVEESAVPMLAEEAARRLFVDVAFLSTKGLLPDEGTFESSMATFRVKQIVVEQAARVVLLVDHTKFHQRALCKVLDITQIDEVITDAGAPADGVASLQQRGLTVRVAPEGSVVASAVDVPA
jgi:hypothetical protein